MSKEKIIIIVDDQVVNLKIGINVLSGAYKVLAVTSGKKLIEVLNKIKPDLILLDIDMPEMNGFETMKKIKQNPETTYIPVIFLTGRDDEQSKAEASSLGAADFIHKPFLTSSLITHIENCLLVEDTRGNYSHKEDVKQVISK